MTLLEKIKINIDYLFGKADPSLYAPSKNINVNKEKWQARWEIYAAEKDGFIWYGVDSEGNLAEFGSETAYVPEAYFQSVHNNNLLLEFFENLPEITTGNLPENLRKEIQPAPEKVSRWTKYSNRGIFIFDEPGDFYWYNSTKRYEYDKNPYELMSAPNDYLKCNDLPIHIQKLLEPYHFENLKFEDCQFLDVSKYFYCEE